MKKIYQPILLVFGIMAASISHAQIDSGLIAAYSFDSNAQDFSGNGFHGTVSGAVLTTDRKGIANMAYKFNGSSDHIAISNLSAEFGSEVSVSFWAKGPPTQNGGVLRATPDDLTNRLSITYNYNHNGENTLFFDYGSIYSGGRMSLIPFAKNVGWQHVVVISSASKDSMLLFLDGILVKATKGHDTYSSTTNSINIGGGSNIFFTGSLDEVYIYNRAISRADIAKLADANVSLSTASTPIESRIVVFPNPSTSGIFKISNAADISRIQVTNITGAVVTEAMGTLNADMNIDISDRASGVYFARITFTDKTQSIVKLVK